MDLTTTAQAANSLASALATVINTPWVMLVKYLALALVGLVLVPTFKQHLIEMADAAFHLPSWAKLIAPTALSTVAGLVLKSFGVDNTTALSAAAIFASMTHIINETPLALDLGGKQPAIVQGILRAVLDASKTAGKVGMLVLGLLVASVALKADVVPAAAPVAGWCAGPSIWAGSALYRTTGGGLTPDQSAVGGVQFAGYLGSWQGQAFDPTYTLGLFVGLDTEAASNYPAAGLQGGWYMAGVPLTGFIGWRLDNQSAGALVGVGTSVQFTGWIPFLYLGKPGN